MHTDLTILCHRSQHHYLPKGEVAVFKHHVDLLKERLELYKLLRDHEVSIFQSIANQLEEVFEQENPKIIKKALKHWISALRYCAMAMLLNNHEYLQHRLLEWLTDIIQAHQMQEMENYLYEFLQIQLSELLTVEQIGLLNPFLEQARNTLLSSPTELQAVEALI